MGAILTAPYLNSLWEILHGAWHACMLGECALGLFVQEIPLLILAL